MKVVKEITEPEILLDQIDGSYIILCLERSIDKSVEPSYSFLVNVEGEGFYFIPIQACGFQSLFHEYTKYDDPKVIIKEHWREDRNFYAFESFLDMIHYISQDPQGL